MSVRKIPLCPTYDEMFYPEKINGDIRKDGQKTYSWIYLMIRYMISEEVIQKNSC